MSKRRLLIGFEVRRHIRKMPFWVMSAAVPLLSLALLALVQLSGGAIIKSSTLDPDSGYNFLYRDSGNHIDANLAARIGGTRIDDIEAAKEAVRHGTANTLIAYPEVLTAAPIQIYENNRGLVGNQLSTALATQTSAAFGCAEDRQPGNISSCDGECQSRTHRIPRRPDRHGN